MTSTASTKQGYTMALLNNAEEVQKLALGIITEPEKNRLPLSIIYTAQGESGDHSGFAETALRITRGEIETCSIPDKAKIGIVLVEHCLSPESGKNNLLDMNTKSVRQNLRSVYTRELPKLRAGITEYSLSVYEFDSHPDSWQMSPMECIVHYLDREFDAIIVQPYFIINENIGFFEPLRHCAFKVGGIGHEKKFFGGHEIDFNCRSDFDFGRARIIITSSLPGIYEKEIIVDSLNRTLNSLRIISNRQREGLGTW